MSIYDKASLVLIPSGTKTSKVYSQKPTSGDGDFTFSRSTMATRVNADGNIEKETMNLLLRSNNFGNTWNNVNTTETSGQSGYDGSSDAWRINLNSGTATKLITQAVTALSGVYTASFYAKAGTHSIVQIGTSTQSNIFVSFDLSDGSVGSLSANAISAKATDVGSSWYRIEVAFLSSNANGISIAAVDSLSATRFQSTSSTGNFYIQDAQLEQGLVARDYIETTTTAVEGGITDNVPRLDYTDSSCPALLLEPQRTNLIAQSEYFGAKWTLIQSVKSDGVLSPSGELTAVTITDDGLGGSSSNVRIQADNFTISASTKYTFSAYVKANPNTIIKVITRNDDALRGGTFNISNLTFTAEQGTETGNVKDFGNGFYRISTTWTSGSDTSIGIGIGFPNVTRDGTNSFTLWGAQMEEASYASSYIPTYGSAVTRNMEPLNLFDLQDNGLVTSTTGTLFLHPNDYSQNAIQFGFEDDSNTSGFRIRFRDASILIYERVGGSNVEVADINESNAEKKLAISWNNTNLLVSVNGTTTTHTITSAASGGVQNLKRLNSSSVLIPMNQILVFPTQLTEAELNDLTTI